MTLGEQTQCYGLPFPISRKQESPLEWDPGEAGEESKAEGNFGLQGETVAWKGREAVTEPTWLTSWSSQTLLQEPGPAPESAWMDSTNILDISVAEQGPPGALGAACG